MRRWRRSFGIAVVLAAVASGAGCWRGSDTPARTACDAARRQFCDPARSIDVHVGQTFTLIFHANSSIGDQWRFEEPIDAAILAFKGTDSVTDTPRAAGSGHTEIWTFTAAAPGTAHIRLGNYYRNGPVTEHRDYTVAVQ